MHYCLNEENPYSIKKNTYNKLHYLTYILEYKNIYIDVKMGLYKQYFF